MQPENGLLVIAVCTPPDLPRNQIRQRVRLALRQALGKLLHCTPAAIELYSQAGQAIRLLQPQCNIGLSVSHERGLSLAAINLNGAIGVDLMTLASVPTTQEIHILALEYLGNQVAEMLALLSREQQSLAFAQAWTEFEARLKCMGENLSEWNLAAATRRAACTSRLVQMTETYVATVALKDYADKTAINQ